MAEYEFSLQRLVDEESKRLEYYPELFLNRAEVTGVTIDPEGSMDLDDAIFVKKTETGYEVAVSVVDVSVLVSPHSYLDQVSFERSFSRYRKPEQNNIYMTHDMVAENLLSLEGNEARPTITVSMEVGESGEIKQVNISKTLMRARENLTYEDVLGYDGEEVGNGFDPRSFFEVAKVLQDKRIQDGALVLDDIDDLSEGDKVSAAVAEYMIVANQSITDYLVQTNTPFLLRNTAPIDETEAETVRGLQVSSDISKEEVRKSTLGYIGKSEYSPQLVGHRMFNRYYAQFTSPGRRYSDMVNHQILSRLLDGEESPYTMDDLNMISKQINTREAEERKYKYKKQRADVSLDTEAEFKRIIERGSYKKIFGNKFTEVLRYSIENNFAVSDLEDVVVDRLYREDNIISIEDLYLIAFATPPDEWQNARACLADHLDLFPGRALPVLEKAMSDDPNYKTGKLRYSTKFVPRKEKRGNDHHIAHATFEMPGFIVPVVNGYGDEISKKLSIKKAYASLLANLAYYRGVTSIDET